MKKVTVKNGETAKISFKNDEPTGKISIYKVDGTGTPVGGATFKITAAEDIKNVSGSKTYYKKGTVVATIISNNETGIASKDLLPLGKYQVQEVSVGGDYLLSSTVYTANIEYKNSNTPVVEFKIKDVVNLEPTGEITIEKEDVDLENEKRFDGTYEHGDATIKDSVYKLYANENIYNVSKSLKYFSKDEEIAIFTYDEKGQATIKITNTSTPAKLRVNGIILSGLPVRRILFT